MHAWGFLPCRAAPTDPAPAAACASSCRGTPGLLSTLGLLAAVGAAALVYVVPDDSTSLVAAQVVGASALGAAAVAALVGSSILGSLQKV